MFDLSTAKKKKKPLDITQMSLSVLMVSSLSEFKNVDYVLLKVKQI